MQFAVGWKSSTMLGIESETERLVKAWALEIITKWPSLSSVNGEVIPMIAPADALLKHGCDLLGMPNPYTGMNPSGIDQ